MKSAIRGEIMKSIYLIPTLLLSCIYAPAPVVAAPYAPLLIGTYTGGASKGIYVYAFNTRTGKIETTPTQVMPASNPSWLTVSADRRFLFAVDENGEGQRDTVGRVSSYRLDGKTGRLAFINRKTSLGAEPTYASLSKDNRYVFVANYAVSADPGGTLAVLPVGRQGALGAVTQIKTHRASQVNAERQMSPHVHSVVPSPDGRYVFAQDLGADRIYVYRYDPQQTETPLTALKEQPFIALPAGSGPRHLVFSQNGKQAYLTLEMAGQVAMFDYADGHLALRQILPLAAAGFQGKVGAGALHLSPDGRFLVVTDRGEDNQLVTFAIAPETGALRFVSRRAAEGAEPREFTFDRTGRFVIAANQHGHAVVVFARDPATGRIGEALQSLAIEDASDVKFVD